MICKYENSKLLFLSDTNSRQIWGDHKENSKGNESLNFVIENNLIILNDNEQEPTLKAKLKRFGTQFQ